MTTRFAPPYAAGQTITYECQLQDETGIAVPGVNISVLTLSLVDTITGAVINGITTADILNVGRGTIDSGGNLMIILAPADTGLVDATAAQEFRSMVIDFTYSVSKVGRHQVDFILSALAGA